MLLIISLFISTFFIQNSVSAEEALVGYPANPQGQAKCIRDVMAYANEAGALGVFYWEGAWVPVGSDYDSTKPSGRNMDPAGPARMPPSTIRRMPANTLADLPGTIRRCLIFPDMYCRR